MNIIPVSGASRCCRPSVSQSVKIVDPQNPSTPCNPQDRIRTAGASGEPRRAISTQLVKPGHMVGIGQKPVAGIIPRLLKLLFHHVIVTACPATACSIVPV